MMFRQTISVLMLNITLQETIHKAVHGMQDH